MNFNRESDDESPTKNSGLSVGSPVAFQWFFTPNYMPNDKAQAQADASEAEILSHLHKLGLHRIHRISQS